MAIGKLRQSSIPIPLPTAVVVNDGYDRTLPDEEMVSISYK